MSKNLTHLTAKKGIKNNLFERLQEAAADKGAPTNHQMKNLADEYLIGEANVLGATSFYDFLKPENKDKKIYVCNGTACMLSGTQAKVKEEALRYFEKSEIGNICCLGRCHENAAFQIDDINYSGMDIEHLPAIVTEQFKPHSKHFYHTEVACLQPVIMHPIDSLKSFYSLYDYLSDHTAEDLIRIMKQSGLRGRGGAGFPIGQKLDSCYHAQGDQKYIVCNADEGDPGSYSDKFVLEQHPHLVLFGMLMCGSICGADMGILYIRKEYPRAILSMENAIKEFEALKTEFSKECKFEFKIIKGAGSYVCGEETALLASIEGQRPEVRIRPPYPTEYGLYGCPTLVNNVETLAHIYFILEHGAAIYESIGTDDSVGTKLVSLNGLFNQPGVYEVEFGTPLRTIIDECGHGFKIPVKALQIGGPLGAIVPEKYWDKLNFDIESFEAAGFSIGHGSIIAIPEDYPMIELMEHLFTFTAHESCGKCFPCRLGSQRGMEMLQNALKRNSKMDRTLFNDLLETMELGSLCGLGSELPLPIKNIMEHFSEELEPFFQSETTSQS